MKHPYRWPLLNWFVFALSLIGVLPLLGAAFDASVTNGLLCSVSVLLVALVYKLSCRKVRPTSAARLAQLKGRSFKKRYKHWRPFGTLSVILLVPCLAFGIAKLFYALQVRVFGRHALLLISPGNRLISLVVFLVVPFLLFGLGRLAVFAWGTSAYRDALEAHQIRREKILKRPHYDYFSEAWHFVRVGGFGLVACTPLLVAGFTTYTAAYPDKVVQSSVLSAKQIPINNTTALTVAAREKWSCGKQCNSYLEVKAVVSQPYGASIDLGTNAWPQWGDPRSYYSFRDVTQAYMQQNVDVVLVHPSAKVTNDVGYKSLLTEYYSY